MNVFRTDGYYRYMLLAVSTVCVFAAALSFYTKAAPVELFLMCASGGVAVFITMQTWSVKIWTDKGFLHKESLLGCRAIEMALITDITVMSMRGRYVFMALTTDNFLVLSTMLENFPALKDILRNNTTEKAFAEMDKISDDQITRKKTTMKLMLAVLLIICAVIVVYRFKWILL